MTRDILLAALEGLEARRKAIDEQIATVRAELGLSAETEPAKPATRRNWKLGDEGKRRIADAQKKRWEEYRNRDKSA